MKFATRSVSNQSPQLQRLARIFKFRIHEVKLYNVPESNNTDADLASRL